MAEIKDLQDRVAALEAKADGRDSPTPSTTDSESGTPQPPKPTRLLITNSPPTAQNSRLLDLPPEIRDEIYRLAVVSSQRGILVDSNGYARPALLIACKEIYAEVLPIFNENHRFCLKIRNFDSGPIARWYQETRHLKWQPNLSIQTNLQFPHWKNLLEWVKSFHARDFSRSVCGDYTRSKNLLNQEEVIDAIFRVATTLRSHPWELMQLIMKDIRPALITLDVRWAHDH